MCRPVTCKTCGLTTWAGCGQHIDAVLANVPVSRRCRCDRDTAPESRGIFAALFRR
jgi:hypothetical protein